jgi:hypothetical protein
MASTTARGQQEPHDVPRDQEPQRGLDEAGAPRAPLDEARRSLEALARDLQERIVRHPFRALALALGAGYVAGGGLFTPLTGRLVFGSVRVGLRLAALPVMRDELTTLVDALTAERQDEPGKERRTQ